MNGDTKPFKNSARYGARLFEHSRNKVAAEDGVGCFLAGRLRQSVVRCRGQWKLTIADKDGPRGSCRRKVCRLLTSIVGWQPCVETLPRVAEQYFDGLRRQGKWARQVLLLHDSARSDNNKQTIRKLSFLDIPSRHIHSVLQTWPTGIYPVQQNGRNTVRQKIS